MAYKAANYMPGGVLMEGWGGKLYTMNWSNVGTTGTDTEYANTQTLDVARWQLHYDRIAPAISYSGCCGSLRRREVACDWKVYAKIWWDGVNYPDDALRILGDGMSLQLRISNPTAWATIGAKFGASFIPYYASPLCVLTQYNLYDPSECDEDGIVYADAILEGDSLMWFISSQQLHTNYSAYVSILRNQGFIPNN